MSYFALMAWLGGYTDGQLFTLHHLSACALINSCYAGQRLEFEVWSRLICV